MGYAALGNIEIKESLVFDVCIIGAGLAGLYAAYHLGDKLSCCVLSKGGQGSQNSCLAQGGMAAAVGADDAYTLHMEDTIVAGAGLCDRRAVEVLCREAAGDMKCLETAGVPFDLNPEGSLRLAQEGGHSRRRVLHAGGDKSGQAAVNVLQACVENRANVQIFEDAFLADILLDDTGAVTGALVCIEGAYYQIITGNLILATGGIGAVYQQSTNPPSATGDGIAAAKRAGAILSNMEFVQFHPTGFYQAGKTSGQSFLISEAMRGEGAVLVNGQGQRFMEGVHPREELAPRDIVARAIYREMERNASPCVYLDIRHLGEDKLKARFPSIFCHCLKQGINIGQAPIPVCPVQHYFIGGIQTDLHGRTNIPGLYAVGEAACTGVHGANRLAANSLLECLVFGRRAAQMISREPRVSTGGKHLASAPRRPEKQFDLDGLHQKIQYLMQNQGGLLRQGKALEQAQGAVAGILEDLAQAYTAGQQYIEVYNLAIVANNILNSAIWRKESVGAHFRLDWEGQ